MNDHISELVAELEGAGCAQIRERARCVLFPRAVVDNESLLLLDALVDLCDADDTVTRHTAIQVAVQVLRSVKIESVAVDEPDSDLFQSWIQRLEYVVLRPLAETSLECNDAEVLALYWIGISERVTVQAVDISVVRRRIENYLQNRERSPLQLAAAVEIARLGAGERLPSSAARVLNEFLTEPSFPGDEISDVLGDARTAVRLALDGSPEQRAMFVNSCESESALARFQNIGQCLRIMETWRDAPVHAVPLIAAHLWDRALPVRGAAVGAIYRSGQAAYNHLDEVSELLHDPFSELDRSTPPHLMAMLRAEALATLVSFGRADAVEFLRSYLADPYGNVPVGTVVADARFCAAEVVAQIARWLRAAADPSVNIETIRYLSGILDGLVTWESRAEPLMPELAALLRSGTARPAVIEVLAAIGPGIAAVEDLLLVQLRSVDATQAQRGVAAYALVRNNLASADEALAVLSSMLGQPDSAPVAVRYLADLDCFPALWEYGVPTSVLERLVTESGSSAVRASSAKVLWNSGWQQPALAEALVREAGPCSVGIRCVEWLAVMGKLAGPYRPVLSRVRKARRRSRCEHIGERVVADDEKYQAAIAQALPVIPRT